MTSYNAATAPAQQAEQHEHFSCPECQQFSTLKRTEEQQRCEHCKSHHKTEHLMEDGFTL